MPTLLLDAQPAPNGTFQCPPEVLNLRNARFKLLVIHDEDKPKEVSERIASFNAWLKKSAGSATSGLTTDEIMILTRRED